MSALKTIQFIIHHPLNRKRKIKAILHFLKWQIASRLFNGAFIYQWIQDAQFIVKKGETGLTGNIYTGLHELIEMGFLLHVLRKEDLFIDIGANAGSYTLLAAKVIGASCMAFEPVPETYHRLVNNIKINDLEQRVMAFNKGLADQNGQICFTSDRDTRNRILKEDEYDPHAIQVNIARLDDELEDQNPFLLKIDVEGYEWPVLKGADRILKKESLQAIIMELNGSGEQYGFKEDQILSLMQDHGFKMYSYDPFKRQLINLNQHKNQSSNNTLFIRDEKMIVDRLIKAERIQIHDDIWI